MRIKENILVKQSQDLTGIKNAMSKIQELADYCTSRKMDTMAQELNGIAQELDRTAQELEQKNTPPYTGGAMGSSMLY